MRMSFDIADAEENCAGRAYFGGLIRQMRVILRLTRVAVKMKKFAIGVLSPLGSVCYDQRSILPKKFRGEF
jgi:hypothetical protein